MTTYTLHKNGDPILVTTDPTAAVARFNAGSSYGPPLRTSDVFTAAEADVVFTGGLTLTDTTVTLTVHAEKAAR